jgi:hypothetical protein
MIGLVILLLALLAASSSPGALSRIDQEPEDFWGLISLAIACLVVGASVILVGVSLVWRGSPRWASPLLVSRLSLFAAVFMALIAAVGFWPDDPGSRELRLLLAPAVMLMISHLLLRRLRS